MQWHDVSSLQPPLPAVQGSNDSLPSVSQVPEITDMHHHAQLIFIFLVEIGSHHVGQADLQLLTSGDSPTSASQSAGITDRSQGAQPIYVIFLLTDLSFSQNLKYIVPLSS